MRRTLAFIFLAPILMGLGLSTEAISPIPSRPKTGAGAMAAGVRLHVFPFRQAMGIPGAVA